MPRPKRSEQQPDLAEAIKDAAWVQIAEDGAAALSLRAIARNLRITAPAIYNYYSNRDDLVTALIVDAFTSLGQAQRQAVDDHELSSLAERFTELGLAYRSWATTYPQRYQLIFGTPLPKYNAPADTTVPAAAWSMQPLIGVLQDLYQNGQLRINTIPPATPALQKMLTDWQVFTGGLHSEVLYLALVVWSRVHGLVSLEIGGQMPSFIHDPGEVFQREIEYICCSLIQSS